jgi:RIP metalloprotease RseP
MSKRLKSIYGIIIGVCSLSFVIAIHESGHFFFGRLFNVPVQSFSIGFGPALVSYKPHNTTYDIRAIPFGGFVMFYDARSLIASYLEYKYDNIEAFQKDLINIYPEKSYYEKIIILLGGIIFNILLWILMYLLVLILYRYRIKDNYEQKITLRQTKQKLYEYINRSYAQEKEKLSQQNSKKRIFFGPLWIIRIFSYAFFKDPFFYYSLFLL